MLIIIEAHGKVKALDAILKKLGLHAQVMSTVGHLYTFGEKLWPMGINKNLEPNPLTCRKPALVERLKAEIAQHSEIVIATDPDAEGHLIASDVAKLCVGNQDVFRALFYAIDLAHVEEGLNQLTDMDDTLAGPAFRRRFLDRLICSGLSSEEHSEYVGRVLSPTLKKVSETEQETDPILKGIPFDGLDIVYHASAMLNKSPADVARIMQKVYERGKLSYHRSDGHHVTNHAAAVIGRAFQVHVNPTPDPDAKAHPAPFPIVQPGSLDIRMPLECMSDEDAVLAVVARQWTGSQHERGNYGLAHHVIESMRSMDLARPSTAPDAASRICTQGTIHADGSLSDKGKRWLDRGQYLTTMHGQKAMSDYIAEGGDIGKTLDVIGIKEDIEGCLDEVVGGSMGMS